MSSFIFSIYAAAPRARAQSLAPLRRKLCVVGPNDPLAVDPTKLTIIGHELGCCLHMKLDGHVKHTTWLFATRFEPFDLGLMCG